MDSLPARPPVSATRGETTRALATLIDHYAPIDGEYQMAAIPSLRFFRYSAPTRNEAAFSKVSLIFAAQGSKSVLAGDTSYFYDTQHYLLTSIDMPVIGQVQQASTEHPYLCFNFDIDLQQVADLVAANDLPAPDESPTSLGISAGELSLDLLDAAYRLARLLETPKHIAVLAPLIEQEIIYRLLMSSQGVRLRQALVANSRAFKITRAVSWIKAHYQSDMRTEELAHHVNMSLSSLHQHFKDTTGLSPLQYQKRLRLFEARRQLVTRASDLGIVAAAVGYENLSQFHREYKRLFGAPPIQDVERIRTEAR